MGGMKASSTNSNSKSSVEAEIEKKAREVNLGKLDTNGLYNVIL
jgi:hypothetical protein